LSLDILVPARGRLVFQDVGNSGDDSSASDLSDFIAASDEDEGEAADLEYEAHGDVEVGDDRKGVDLRWGPVVVRNCGRIWRVILQ